MVVLIAIPRGTDIVELCVYSVRLCLFAISARSRAMLSHIDLPGEVHTNSTEKLEPTRDWWILASFVICSAIELFRSVSCVRYLEQVYDWGS